MDLETYIARYSGETRLQRLLLIAQQCPDEAVATQAFGLAETQMKEDGNLRQYKKVFGLSDNNTSGGEASGDMAMEFLGESNKSSEGNLRRPPPSSATPDESWMAETEATNKDARHILQGRLSASQSQMHREAIRNAYVALAKHDAKTGNSSAALASLFRAMDYCTSRTQSGQLSLVLLEVALNSGCYVQAREYVTKLEHTLQGNAASSAEGTEILQDVAIKLQIASGLERMAQGDYATAATTFSKLCKNYVASKLDWPSVASADDIALYASLLSLATQGRTQILELAEHPEALELVPAMKELLLQWAKANYVKSIQAFSAEGTLLDFPDLYLTSKWEKLCQSIREKCLLEYLKPYQCVRLEHMSKLFPSIPNIQDTLVDLMGRGLLEGAKIDGRANVLCKTSIHSNSNPAVPTLKELGQMENRILDDVHAMLIRLACLEQDLCVSDGMGGIGSGGGGGSSSRRRAAAYGRDHMVEDDDDSSDDEPMMDAEMQAAAAAQNPEDLY